MNEMALKRQLLEQTHGDNEHGKEYGFAALLMRAHAEIWTPVKETQE